jgi:hypothetical protein
MERHQRGPTADKPSPDRSRELALRNIEAALEGLGYGQITVIVQDGVIVQIDRLERKRLR